MTKLVREGDYLLGRGANPRTGTISPLVEDVGIVNNLTTVPAPTKWSQRGDQWVSQEVEKPSNVGKLSIAPSLIPPQIPKTRENQQVNDGSGVVVKRKPVAGSLVNVSIVPKSGTAGQLTPPNTSKDRGGKPLAATRQQANHGLPCGRRGSRPVPAISTRVEPDFRKDLLTEESIIYINGQSSNLSMDIDPFPSFRSASGPLILSSQQAAKETLNPCTTQTRLPSAPLLIEGTMRPYDRTRAKLISPTTCMTKATRLDVHGVQKISSIPTYDNPPPRHLIRDHKMQRVCSRSIRNLPQNKNYGQTVIGNIADPFSAVDPGPKMSSVREGSHPSEQLVNASSHLTGALPLSFEDKSATSTSRAVLAHQNISIPSWANSEDVPLPLSVPRGQVRPNMPSRAIGMRYVPQTTENRNTYSSVHAERTDGPASSDLSQIARQSKSLRQPDDFQSQGHRMVSDSLVTNRTYSLSANAPESVPPIDSGKTSESTENQFQNRQFDGQSNDARATATIVDVGQDLKDHFYNPIENSLSSSSLSSQATTCATVFSSRTDESATRKSVPSESWSPGKVEERSSRFALIKAKLKDSFRRKHSESSTSELVDKVKILPPAPTQKPSLDRLHSSSQREDDHLTVFQVPQRKFNQASSTKQISTETRSPPPSVDCQTKKEGPTANETRVISQPQPLNPATGTTVLDSHVSHPASTTATAISRLNQASLASIGEVVIVVPFKVVRMWLHNNPEVKDVVLFSLSRAREWICVIISTSRLIMNTVRVYSETGETKIETTDGKPADMVLFARDCLRSALYLIILISVVIILGRLACLIFWPLRMVILFVRYLSM